MSSGPLSRRWPERQVGSSRALERMLLGVLPLALTLWLVIAAVVHHWVAEDFSLAYYPAAHRLLAGASPYAVTHRELVSGAGFVYPALAAVLLAPLALVSSGIADHIYTLICLAMVPGTLWLSGVRDWRVYGATLLWLPIIVGWQGENISVPLMFLAALAWRYRDSPLVVGAVTAAAISMKPFLWPLGLWLLATRRFKAAAWAFGSALAFNALAWALVGFNEISTYVRLAGEDTRALWRGGYSLLALAGHLGLGRGAGYVPLVLAAAVLCAALLRQGLTQNSDRSSFTLAVALMLIASPLVWIHYFVLLALPLAITRPRFSALWLLPIGMWLLPPATKVDAWQLLLAWAICAGCLLGVLRDAPVGRRSADRRPQKRPHAKLATSA